MNNYVLRNIISGFLSFVVTLLMFAAMILVWMKFSLLNYENVRINVGDEFYSLYYTEVCDNLVTQTVSTGIPEEVMLSPLKSTMVEVQISDSIEALISGKSFDVSLDYLKDDYVKAFSEYAKSAGEKTDPAKLDELADYCVKTIEDSITIPYANLLASYISTADKYIPIGIAACTFIIIILAVFIFVISKPRHNALRFYGLSFMASGIMGTVLSGYALAQKVSDKLNISSAAYNSALLGISDYALHALLTLSIIFIAVGLVEIIIYMINENNYHDNSGYDEEDIL